MNGFSYEAAAILEGSSGIAGTTLAIEFCTPLQLTNKMLTELLFYQQAAKLP